MMHVHLDNSCIGVTAHFVKNFLVWIDNGFLGTLAFARLAAFAFIHQNAVDICKCVDMFVYLIRMIMA